MIQAVIIDDEKNNIDNLFLLLNKYCPQVHIAATALNANDGKKIIMQHNPELIFLDIQMPGASGFDLLKEISLVSAEIIFVTAYDQYALQAFRFSAIDYLLKPVNTDELKSAVQKATERIQSRKQNLHLENLIDILQKQQQKDEHRIALTSLKETRFVFTRDVMYCEASNNYTTFFLADEEKITVSKPIYEFDEMLAGYGFLRCHQSFLVNKAFIKSFIKEDGGFLLLTNKTQIPVSRNKKEMVNMELQGKANKNPFA